jgi:GTPase SAR1 family protein
MDISERKKQLVEYIKLLKPMAINLDAMELVGNFEELAQDVLDDTYTIVVVGEFNNGKSTFVNALLGEHLLPTGILPTTATINVLRYQEEPAITVVAGETRQQVMYGRESLRQYIAGGETDLSTIDYVEIGTPIDFLKNNIELVDTPGLNDINELRSLVTYHFIPRADVVFFLLDLRTPLRKTEYDFLTETILQNGLRRIIFVANFADAVEQEDIPFLCQTIRQRIAEGTPLSDVEIIDISALEALEAIQEQDEELYEISGFPKVKGKMQSLCLHGDRSQEKLERFQQRFNFLAKQLEFQMSTVIDTASKSSEQLEKESQQLNQWFDEQNEREQLLTSYVVERNQDFKRMVQKSVGHAFIEIEEELCERIMLYHGNQIQKFFERDIPIFLKRKLKNWTEAYTPKIHTLFSKLEQEISRSLSEAFQEKVNLQSVISKNMYFNSDIDLATEEQKDPYVTSGIIVGGASTILIALGGPLFIPIIGMAGLPLLQKKLLQNQLEQMKPQLVAELSAKIQEVRYTFTDSVEDYVETCVRRIYEDTLNTFNDYSTAQAKIIQRQIDGIKQKGEEIRQFVDRVEEQKLKVQQLQLLIEG